MSEIVFAPVLAGAGGVLGVEGRHQWNGGVMLNDRSVGPDDGPRIWVETISGLRSLSDPEDLRDNPIGRSGELERNSVRRGKTVAYNGAVQAQSLADAIALWGEMAAGFQSMAVGRMDVTPNPAWADGFARFYLARCLTLEEGDYDLDANREWPVQIPFALGLRLGDPRFYDPVAVTADTGAIGSGHADVSVTNAGNAGTDPVIDIYGPVTSPTISNQTTGKSLIFNADGGIVIASGHYLRVDFASRRVLYDNTTDRYSKLAKAASSWWDAGTDGLIPGSNAIRLAGSSFSAPSHAHVSFNPAWVS